jgi:phosphoglycolate phosphatase
MSTSTPRFAAKVIAFDLDGTLIDTAPDLARAVNRMLVDLGRDAFPETRIAKWIGDGVARLIMRALTDGSEGEPDPALFERAHARFHAHYLAGVCEHSAPYPDVVEALRRLRAQGRPLACVTNKLAAFTEPLLAELELDHYFELVLSGDTLPRRKPDPLPLEHMCRRLNIAPAEGLLVGDSINDLRAARAAGMPVVLVRYGYNQGVDLSAHAPDAMIDSFRELIPLLVSGA